MLPAYPFQIHYLCKMKIPARQDIFFVSIQFLLFILYCFPITVGAFQIHAFFEYAGFLVAVIGLLVIVFAVLQLNNNLTAFPTPKEEGTLIQTGLYKFVRHPIYSGIILGAIGLGCFLGSGWKIGIGFGLWLLFYFKSSYEERLLANHYPDYEAYKENSSRFFPFF